MRKFFYLFMVLVFTGCTQMYNSNEVSVSDANRVYTYKTGVVQSVRQVVMKDNGSGVLSGAFIGSVLGGLFGKGSGNTLSSLAGTLGGAYAGHEMDKAYAQELFIKLESGQEIVTVVKGVNLRPGDRVRVIFSGRKILRVEKI